MQDDRNNTTNPLLYGKQQAAHDCLLDLLTLFETRAAQLHSHFLDLSEIKIPNGTIFFQETFYQVSFKGTDLTWVSFPGCTFRECVLDHAELENATMRNCHFWRCSLVEMDDAKADTSDCQYVECSYHTPLYSEKTLLAPSHFMSKRELDALYG